MNSNYISSTVQTSINDSIIPAVSAIFADSHVHFKTTMTTFMHFFLEVGILNHVRTCIIYGHTYSTLHNFRLQSKAQPIMTMYNIMCSFSPDTFS